MAETVSYYFDEHMSRKVASALESQGYQVVMAVDVEMVEKDDLSEHLHYATEHKLVLVTCDRPFAGKAMTQTDHSGVICWTGKTDDFGGQIRKLAYFAEKYTLEDFRGQTFWIKD
ncbi:MAG: DUF5615 family PIN-like protein [Anaerolineae bacterium]|nr:DUF5615 family PIN-like protein [Anaerolineae bacterium]